MQGLIGLNMYTHLCFIIALLFINLILIFKNIHKFKFLYIYIHSKLQKLFLVFLINLLINIIEYLYLIYFQKYYDLEIIFMHVIVFV